MTSAHTNLQRVAHTGRSHKIQNDAEHNCSFVNEIHFPKKKATIHFLMEASDMKLQRSDVRGCYENFDLVSNIELNIEAAANI